MVLLREIDIGNVEETDGVKSEKMKDLSWTAHPQTTATIMYRLDDHVTV